MELQTPVVKVDDSELLLALLQRVRAQNKPAFAELYEQTFDRLYGLAYRILDSHVDAEEIVCELFVKVWEQPHRYDEQRGSVTAWLVMQCRSRCLDLLRKQASKQRFSQRLTSEQEALLQYESTPDYWSESLSDQSQLSEAMQELTLEQRQMLSLAYFKGFSHSEIARHTDRPLGTVKTQIRKALRQLHAYLEG
ncbi:MAG: RNA polymerase sigma factor [Pseudomonadales bacterium]